MAHHPLQTADKMAPEDVLEELKARLYNLSMPVPANPAAEPIQLSLYHNTGLRITDMIVELLRNKFLVGNARSFHDAAREDGRTMNCLLENLRTPWGRCSGRPGESTCAGGSSTCWTCRYSVILIAGQINYLTLEYSGLPRTEKSQTGHGWASQPGPTEDLGGEKPDVEAVRKEFSSKVSGLEQKIKDLENDKASAEKTVKNDAKKLGESQERLRKLKSAYDQMADTVKDCVKYLPFDKENTDKADKKKIIWEVGAKQYNALYGMAMFQIEDLAEEKTSERKTLKLDALEYQHRHVKALMKVGKYGDVEKMAKSVLDERRHRPGRQDEKTRDIFKDYCEILEHVNKADVVEREYLQTWCDETLDKELRCEAGTNLAHFKQRRNENEEAAVWYRKVAAFQLASSDVYLAADSALKMLTAQKSLYLNPESANMLKAIWEQAQKRFTSDPNVHLSGTVLSCGQELANFLIGVREYTKAEEVLFSIWEGLGKYGGDEYEDKRAAVARFLISISTQAVEKDNDILLKTISKHAESKVDKKLSLQYKWLLGCLYNRRGDPQKAEETLRAAYKEARALDGLSPSNILTIQIGWDLVQAILDQPGRDAKAEFRSLWEALKPSLKEKDSDRPMARSVVILTTGSSYAELLINEAKSCQDKTKQMDTYSLAKDILSIVWKVKPRIEKFVEHRNPTALADLLRSRDLYGECLVHLGYPSEAVETLTEVLDIRVRWMPNTDGIGSTSTLLEDAREANLKNIKGKKVDDKKKADGEKADEKKAARYQANAGADKSTRYPNRQKEPRGMGLLRYLAGQ
ncbi:hypothetical protein DV737_g5288, partial [Chaetothyriales sp. CBS 132003]